MLIAGKYHDLKVNRISDFGLYLVDDEGNEVLLPNRFVSLTNKEGDMMHVFVYHDSEDRIVATTEHPFATVGQVAFLKVVDKTLHGVFVDWGLEAKHLFVPNRNIKSVMHADEKYVVYIYTDNVTGRAVATTKLNGFLSNENMELKMGEQVDIMVAQELEPGFRVVINNSHWGMVYHNQVFRPIAVGDITQGYVVKISEDNRVDISLQRPGFGGVRDGSQELLSLLEENSGSLPISDDSAPEEIYRLTSMSKKSFKRSAGHLLKIGKIEMSAEGIKIR